MNHVASEHRIDVLLPIAFASAAGAPVAVPFVFLTMNLAIMSRSYPSLFGCQHARAIIAECVRLLSVAKVNGLFVLAGRAGVGRLGFLSFVHNW